MHTRRALLIQSLGVLAAHIRRKQDSDFDELPLHSAFVLDFSCDAVHIAAASYLRNAPSQQQQQQLLLSDPADEAGNNRGESRTQLQIVEDWVCTVCTLVNEAPAQRCAVCESLHPAVKEQLHTAVAVPSFLGFPTAGGSQFFPEINQEWSDVINHHNVSAIMSYYCLRYYHDSC
jgi:Zn-finger in Ran binding protein and others